VFMKLIKFFGLGCTLIWLAGCGLMRAHQEQVSARNNSVIVGRVTADYPLVGPIVVGAWRESENGGARVLAEYSILEATGNFMLIVPPGSYRIVAFNDANRDLRMDALEASSSFPAPVTAGENALIAAIDIDLKKDGQQELLAVGTSVPPKPVAGLQSSHSGALADISAPLFSEAFAADTGYWEGLKFFREGGGNIYCLERFDPQRILVLFVHGARGSPQDWKFAFRHLDSTRYQPCFFYYPTGMSLGGAANLLRMKLEELQQEYFIPRMHIVAHSAGGLVVRDFLGRDGALHPYINTFISISTPWGGESLAKLGVEKSPVVLPSWVDMQPTSKFFAQLYQKPLPESIGHYMLFGYRGGSLLRTNSDGAILIESLLDKRAQAGAREVRGFNESHVSILESVEVFSELNRILKERDASYRQEAAGMLRLQLTDTSVQGDIDSMSSLMLRDAQGRTRSIPLPQSGNVTFSNVPAGEYRLRVRSLRVRMQPEELHVTVRPDAVITAALPLQARQGSICGIVLRQNDEYRAAGLKAAAAVDISRATLRGPGDVRSADTKYAAPDDSPLTQDFTAPGLFCFVDLPDGDYLVELQTASGAKELTARLPIKGWSPLMVNF